MDYNRHKQKNSQEKIGQLFMSFQQSDNKRYFYHCIYSVNEILVNKIQVY